MIISNIRMESNAGWYVGSIEVSKDGSPQPYDRDSLYYPSEVWLKSEYPNSTSLEEAFDRFRSRYGK